MRKKIRMNTTLIIMDYSIHDTKEVGFNKVVFIISKDIFKKFKEIIGNRIKEQMKCDSEEVQEWISPEDKVSMNMWAGYPEFLDFLAEDFKDFLANVEEGDLKSEYRKRLILGCC